MEFNIFDLDADTDEARIGELDNDDASQLGLSPGETRQAILDRIRSELSSGISEFIQTTFDKYGYEIEEDLLETKHGLESVMIDIDNIIYDLDDSELAGSKWDFSDALVYIRGE